MRLPMTFDEMTELHAGKVYNDIKILRFLRNDGVVKDGHFRSRWICMAQCVCGKEFEALFSTITRNPRPSCGCRRRVPKTPWRIEPAQKREKKKAPPKPKPKPAPKPKPVTTVEKALKRKPKAEPRDELFELSKRPMYGSGVSLSLQRLSALWEKLPPDRCCPAWRGEKGRERFARWALYHGFAREKRLVRLNDQEPFHPLNCRFTL